MPSDRGQASVTPGFKDLGLLAPEAMRFQRLNDTGDKLAKLMQRWDDRLILEELSFVEAYVKGRLSIVCDIHIPWHSNKRHSVGAGCHQYHVSDIDPAGAFCADAMYSGQPENWDQEPMLIDVVEFVESPQGKIVSLGRLYDISDQCRNVWGYSLYRSVRSGRYKTIPGFLEREVNARAVFSRTSSDIACDIIQCASETMNGIPNGEGERWMEGFSFNGDNRCIVEIFLDKQSIEVSISSKMLENGFKVLDVACGPLDL